MRCCVLIRIVLIGTFAISPTSASQDPVPISAGASANSVSPQAKPLSILGIPIKRELDAGHLLTFVTLFAGFIAWLVTTIKSLRARARDEARSGALRLLLRLLRERGQPIQLPDLLNQFRSPKLKPDRQAYCGTDYRFENVTKFEAAIYRLDWEGKIDFISPHEIAFRVHAPYKELGPQAMITFVPDRARILKVFQEALFAKLEVWELEPLVQSSLRFDPEGTSNLLLTALNSNDPDVQRRATALLGKLPSISSKGTHSSNAV
jgi:hypothetical protein